MASFAQTAYQWFADGTEAGAAPLADPNTPITVAPNTLVLLRVAISNIEIAGQTFGPGGFQVCATVNGSYGSLGSIDISGYNGGTTPGGLVNAIACTNRLSGSGTFLSYGKTTTQLSGNFAQLGSVGPGKFFNMVVAIKPGNITGDRFIRIMHSGAPLSFPNIAKITVASEAGAVVVPRANHLLGASLCF